MAHLFMEFLRFLGAVFSHWQTWLSGGGIGGVIVLFVGAFEKLSGRGPTKKQYVYLFIVTFFLCSCFLAWVDKDDEVSRTVQAKLVQHDDDVREIGAERTKLGELKAQCSYQSGVVDTLGKQNRDQQTTINNCQTQAIKLLVPEPFRMTTLQWSDVVKQSPLHQTTLLLITNTVVTPIKLRLVCNHPLQSGFAVIVGASALSGGSGVEGRTSFFIGIDSPAWSPEGPLRVDVRWVGSEREYLECGIKRE